MQSGLLSRGYERDVSIRGAPYDFRFVMSSISNGSNDYFHKLRTLVEETYMLNGKRKVVLLSHSLGGLYATWFLNQRPQSWKDKYIDSFISLATPWAGSSDALRALTAGFRFGVPLVNPLTVRKEQRTFETNYLLAPRAEAFPTGKTFIFTDNRNYTASRDDMVAVFRDMRFNTGAAIYQYVREANDPPSVMPRHPGVLTYCIYGTGVVTTDELHFEGKNFPDEQPTVKVTNGDGTVVYASLSACRNWQHLTEFKELPNVDHGAILKGNKGIQAVIDILSR